MHSIHQELPQQLSLLLVDDHQIFLDGLSLALAPLCPELKIHTAESAAAADDCLNQHNIDLILLDLGLPDISGLALLRNWQERGLMVPVAVLSASDSNSDVQAAITAGALGYISKGTRGEALRQALKQILLGEALPAPPANQSPLSLRQQQILQLLANGLPNKSISRELGVSPDTVKTHLKLLFHELKVHNRTACVSAARERGWL
ncbi:response regulator [Pseudomonas sp. 5P_3.1_Bac2]|uniref:response regulator n=1 Tax=Pseudomonas sp. 5P_3.1_Bac2 TaxID=2971617 RepID=UPI0021C9EBFE|nr:response regulator transcription factor [Pseudomonas sp. 5P_3.1_Bac2]MCU1716257.1 response regulator transcription factor [Pseudomonas sp. 5P_3.1_Bac2]